MAAINDLVHDIFPPLALRTRLGSPGMLGAANGALSSTAHGGGPDGTGSAQQLGAGAGAGVSTGGAKGAASTTAVAALALGPCGPAAQEGYNDLHYWNTSNAMMALHLVDVDEMDKQIRADAAEEAARRRAARAEVGDRWSGPGSSSGREHERERESDFLATYNPFAT